MKIGNFLGSKILQVFSLASLLSGLVLVQTINQINFSHDFSSYAAGINYLFKTGNGPYLHFWDIKPVYLFIVLSGFFVLPGITLWSAYFVYFFFLLVFFSSLLIWLSREEPKSKLRLIFLFLLAALVFSNLFYKMFFPSEVIGIDLILLSGLLLRTPKSVPRIFTAFTLSAIAGQTKEVYLFCSLGFLIYTIRMQSRFVKLFTIFVLSQFFVLIGAILFLNETDALTSYLTMTSDKSHMFTVDPLQNLIKLPILSMRNYLQNYTLLGFVTPLCLSLAYASRILRFVTRSDTHLRFRMRIRTIDRGADSELLKVTLVSILLGLVWQGKIPNEHYAISILPIICLLVFRWLSNNPRKSFWITIFSIAMTLPSLSNTCMALQITIQNTLNAGHLVSKIVKNQDHQNFTVPVTRCLQVAYGWESGAYYYYSGTKPCSKYFLSPLLEGNSALSSRFRNEMLINPPSEIVYQPKDAGLDVQQFEKSVFPYAQILERCYSKAEFRDGFRSLSSSKTETSECIKSVLYFRKQ